MHVVITGASSGFGAATARQLATPDNKLSLGARRTDRLDALELQAASVCNHPLDVTDESSVEAFLAAAKRTNGPIDVLINNAGLARGVETVANATGAAWREMIETNVMGVLHMTRRVVPGMVDRGSGHIVMIGSVAGYDAYPGGSVYCATKRALQSIVGSLRHEIHGSGVRVTLIDPGLAETEFSVVRFSGDADRAKSIYEGARPLTAEDVAECIVFAITRPPHVNIGSMLVLATDQASATRVHRR